MRDIKSVVGANVSLSPAARNASANGSAQDLQGYEAAMVVVQCGAITDGTHTPKVQESDDNSTFTDVAASDLVGAFVQCTANSVQRAGYIGSKRYIRAVMTVAGATTGALSSAVILPGHASQNPVA